MYENIGRSLGTDYFGDTEVLRPVVRHMADMEAIHTYEGTETIQTLIVGKDITGVGAFA
jgi:alkylation response protein AidB-like acyl-CoA dehydrogenase